MHFHFLALFLLLQHLPTIQNIKTFSWFPCFFLSISLKVVIFYCSSTFTLQIFLLSVPILHHRIPSPCGDWRGRCPKLKGPNVPYLLQNIGIQPNPQKCQTANSNKCQITLFALGVCKICPGRTFFSPIPSPTAAPIYFVHFRKVQVLNLGRKSNQSAIWSKIFRTFVVWHQFFS